MRGLIHALIIAVSWLLALCMASRTLPTPAPLGELRRIARGSPIFQLYLQGKKTKLTFEMKGEFGPTLTIYRSSRLVCGMVDTFVSGAYTHQIAKAFIQYRGGFWIKDGYVVSTPFRESVLLSASNEGLFLPTSNVFLFERGRFVNIGPACMSRFRRARSVEGWILIEKDGRLFRGTFTDPPPGVSKQFFVWRHGKRKVIATRLYDPSELDPWKKSGK